MLKKKFDAEQFKDLLQKEHNWPATYTFKFVIPKDKLTEIEAIFEKDELKLRDSSKGNYVSITVTKYMISSEDVMSVYEECAEIEGLISL